MGMNTFNSVAVPVGDGVGAALSVVGQGLKTFVIGGEFIGDIIIEGGVGGRFAPIVPKADKSSQFRDVPCVVDEVRVRISNFVSGAPLVFVGGAPITNVFGSLTVPVGDGPGPVLDTSVFGAQKTIVVDGVFDRLFTFEVSEDASGPFAPIGTIDKTNNVLNITIVSRFLRVVASRTVISGGSIGVGGADLQSGGSGGGNVHSFVFKPGGGEAGPVEFESWAVLDAAKEATRAAEGGSFEILIDDSIVSPAVIPAGGPYDLTNCRLIGRDAVTELDLADGSSSIGFRHISNNLIIQNRTTGTSFDDSLSNNDIITIDGGSAVTNKTASTSIWDASNLAGGDAVSILADSVSVIGGGGSSSGPIIDGFINGSICVAILGLGSTLQNESFGGAVGAILLVRMNTMTQWAKQTNWLGTEFPGTLYTPASLMPNPFRAAIATVGITLAFGEWGRFDVSGAPVVQTLPAISTASANRFAPGAVVLVTEESGNLGLTLVPVAGDTINGSASAIPVPAGGAIYLASDGISNWKTLNTYDPGTIFQLIEVVTATGISSVLGNGVRYIPFLEGDGDTIEFQFLAQATGVSEIVLTYAMSAANGGDVDLRLSVLISPDGADPSDAATLRALFTVVPGNDVLQHHVDSSNSSTFALSLTKGDFVYCKIQRPVGDTHTGDMRALQVALRGVV